MMFCKPKRASLGWSNAQPVEIHQDWEMEPGYEPSSPPPGGDVRGNKPGGSHQELLWCGCLPFFLRLLTLGRVTTVPSVTATLLRAKNLWGPCFKACREAFCCHYDRSGSTTEPTDETSAVAQEPAALTREKYHSAKSMFTSMSSSFKVDVPGTPEATPQPGVAAPNSAQPAPVLQAPEQQVPEH